MTLRLTDEETEALRGRAEAEGRSMQEVARQAVREYVDGATRRARIDAIARGVAEDYREALDRLGSV